MDCLFCELIKNEKDPTLIHCFSNGAVYLNKNQFFYGRILYVLNEHWVDISEIPPSVFSETSQHLHILSRIIKSSMKADLINVASLGNHVPHMHWHIIPRYKNDSCWGNPPWPHGEAILPEDEFDNLKKRIKTAITSYTYRQN